MESDEKKSDSSDGKESNEPAPEFDSAAWETSPSQGEKQTERKSEDLPSHTGGDFEGVRGRDSGIGAATAAAPAPEGMLDRKAVGREQQGDSELHTAPASKIGLLGGKQVGKSYLFHGIVYRTLDNDRAGAVSRYIRSSNLWVADSSDANPVPVQINRLIKSYEGWLPFGSTVFRVDERWYRLRLEFNNGLLGKDRAYLDLEFLDGSGEGFTRPLGMLTQSTWEAAFKNAGIMVFCLPIWAAFPADLNSDDQNLREIYLEHFGIVLGNYRAIRNSALKVRTILALTMSDDDVRCSLRDLIQRWVKPYMEDPEANLGKLRSRSGITRYLAGAHKISDYLLQQFRAIRSSPLVSKIPKDLDFGHGLPWIIPVSAVEGKTLKSIDEARKINPKSVELDAKKFGPPVPVHVELPLLAAICENHNALM